MRLLPGTEIIPAGERFSLEYTRRLGKRNIDTAIKGKPVIIVEGSFEAEYKEDITTVIGKLDDKGGQGGIRWGGLVVAEQGRVSLKGVKLIDAVYGVLACGSAEVFMDKVDLTNCGIGVISANEAFVKMKNCGISAHATSGIELYDSGRVEAAKCMISSNRQSGVMARHRSRFSLSGCEITHNRKGVHIKDGAVADMKKNLFHANGLDVDSLKKYETKPLPVTKESVSWRGMVEIKEDVIIPFGSTLRIEEGTKIFVSSYSAGNFDFYAANKGGKRKITSDLLCDVIVEGNIVVEGSSRKPVVFIAPGGFGSFILSGRGVSSSLKNFVFNGRGTAFFIMDENSAKFEKTVIEDSFAGCVISEGARPSFKDCSFVNCSYGVLIYDEARPFFTGCSFTSCETAAGTRGQATPFFRDCVFEKNKTALVSAGKARPDCASSSVRENTDGFILFEKSSAKISGNTFVKNNSAVKLKGDSFAEISKNAFIKNKSAVLTDASAESETTANSFIKNGTDCEYASTEFPTVKGVISENEVWGGTIELRGDLLVEKGVRVFIKSGTKITVKPSEKDFVFFRDVSGSRNEMTRTGLVDIIVEGVFRSEDMVISAGAGVSPSFDPAWGGFMFVKNAEGALKGATVKNADTAFGVFDKSAVFANECVMENCRNGAFLHGQSIMNIKKCRFIGGEKAVRVTDGSVCNISLSVISGNNCGLIVSGGAMSAENNLISKNSTGTKIESGSAVFKKNSFLANNSAVITRVAFLDQNNKFFENKTDISEQSVKK
ncbi:MAG: NosD domain-containing protein [Elusimicrobiota bacterium]|nr:NosD domain-containing protein [Elusimicrobiota bacterium]